MPAPSLDPDYIISTDLAQMQWPLIHQWLASSYWSPGISLERVQLGARNSALVIGIFRSGEQVGFGRVISDKSRFAYICDVWVDAPHRGKGLARALVGHALNHPDFQTVNWVLATLDAHRVYASLGFKPLQNPEKWMTLGKFCTHLVPPERKK